MPSPTTHRGGEVGPQLRDRPCRPEPGGVGTLLWEWLTTWGRHDAIGMATERGAAIRLQGRTEQLDGRRRRELLQCVTTARLSFCWHSLSIPIETPTRGRGGCSRMTELSPTANHLCSVRPRQRKLDCKQAGRALLLLRRLQGNTQRPEVSTAI